MDGFHATPSQGNLDRSRKTAHPGAGAGIEFARGVCVPGRRKPIALTSLDKTAAAITRLEAERLLAISHDDLDARESNEFDCGERIGAVGDDIARADNPTIRYPEPLRLLEHRQGSFEIAVRTAKREQWKVLVHFP